MFDSKCKHYQPRYTTTFDCEEWTQLLLDTGLIQKTTMKLDGQVKSTRFDSPNGYFYVIVRGNHLKIEAPKEKTLSADLMVGGISFRYVESKIEQLLLRDIIEG